MSDSKTRFLELLRVSGWKQAQAARELNKTRATVSRYVSGDIEVPEDVIKLFEMILASRQPGALAAALEAREGSLDRWELELVEEMRGLGEQDREQILQELRLRIDGLRRRVGHKDPPEGATEIIQKVRQTAVRSRKAKP